MELPIYQVDAFSDCRFAGNPAAVVPMREWLDDALMQDIAAENNLSETAFLVPEEEGHRIRWFTPSQEVDLCGHATLAAAWVLFRYRGHDAAALTFASRSGTLQVRRGAGGELTLDLPSEVPEPGTLEESVLVALNRRPREVWSASYSLLVYDREADIRSIDPDFDALRKAAAPPLVVTAPGEAVDFVSRFFAPCAGIDEDPVTGSAHCLLVPYWAERLGNKLLRARQVSIRGGDLSCRLDGDRVHLSGSCALYLEGKIFV